MRHTGIQQHLRQLQSCADGVSRGRSASLTTRDSQPLGPPVMHPKARETASHAIGRGCWWGCQARSGSPRVLHHARWQRLSERASRGCGAWDREAGKKFFSSFRWQGRKVHGAEWCLHNASRIRPPPPRTGACLRVPAAAAPNAELGSQVIHLLARRIAFRCRGRISQKESAITAEAAAPKEGHHRQHRKNDLRREGRIRIQGLGVGVAPDTWQGWALLDWNAGYAAIAISSGRSRCGGDKAPTSQGKIYFAVSTVREPGVQNRVGYDFEMKTGGGAAAPKRSFSLMRMAVRWTEEMCNVQSVAQARRLHFSGQRRRRRYRGCCIGMVLMGGKNG